MLAVADFDKLIDKLFAAISPEKRAPPWCRSEHFGWKNSTRREGEPFSETFSSIENINLSLKSLIQFNQLKREREKKTILQAEVQGQWWRWRPTLTIYVSGAASLVATGHALIEALKLLECSKHKTGSNNCPGTSPGELDQVERHLNQGSPISVWLGIRVSYKPKRGAGGAVILHFMRNPSGKLKNVLPIIRFTMDTFTMDTYFF